MPDDLICANRARDLLRTRERQDLMFPGTLFDGGAWIVLLHLFVAHVQGSGMSEVEIVRLANTSRVDGQRWLYHLMQDRLVEPRLGGDDIVLTDNALKKLRVFLSYVQDPSVG
jgi:hypothetical protein